MSKKISFDDAANRIASKFTYLKLLEFNGVKKNALFLDYDYGEFYGIFNSVERGKKNHKERARDNYRKAFGSEDIIKKRKKGCIEKYGVENPMQSDLIKNKVKKTNIEKYGGHPQKNKEIRDKTKCTVKMVYGTENVSQNKDVRNKITQSFIDSGRYYNIDGYTLKDYFVYNNISGSYSNVTQNVHKYGLNIAKDQKSGKTLIEICIEKFLQKYNIIYNYNSYLIEKNLKPDFVINSKIIVECDGLYYHSDVGIREEIRNNKNWHKERQEKYKKLGYKALFFREDEINNKLPIIESIILAKLGRFNDRIFARKTKIIELPSKKAAAFFENNHLMGRGSGQCYALIYEDKIVSAIRIIKKKDYIDISRFCSALNTKVVGGLGKLLKHVIREHNSQKIVSFVDMRYGDGHSLEKLGFVEKTNHVSFKWTDFQNTYHRLNFKGNSGYESGMFKIWDCGQKKFELEL